MIAIDTLGLAHLVVLIASVGISLATVVLLMECLAALCSFRHAAHEGEPISCSYVVVIPAKDEVGTIERTLHAALDQIGPHGRVVVVADNCTDQTADVSASLGAEVILRNDPTRRGKGYALDFAVRHLSAEPPEVVLVLDADCIPEPGAIKSLVTRCRQLNKPVQSRYDLLPPAPDAGHLARVGALAWRIKNVVRPQGLKELGMPCLLMGTGMAFPWSTLARADLQTGHIVEDMVLGLELAASGSAPLFIPDARVVSTMPPSREGQTTQRTRWETGHLQVIAGLLPRYLAKAVRERNFQLLVLVLHAAVPPLALLCILIMACAAVSGVIAWAGGPVLSLLVSLGTAAGFAVAVTTAWFTAGRDVMTAAQFALIPGYIALKLPIYARALAGKDPGWIRSKRN